MISGDLRLETSVIPRMPSIREDGPACKVVPPSDVNVGLYMGMDQYLLIPSLMG
jgi:hypothetical protein